MFDPEQFTIGLVFDLELGNLLKATRFGYVSRSRHGNSMLVFEQQRKLYQDTVVELSEPRFEFMNTLFELSRASLWTQLVEIHGRRPLDGVSSYADIYRIVDDALDETHNAGALKADIVADPSRFVDLDPDIVTTLSDQRAAGKQLLLITNSDWSYAQQMMHHCIDPFCVDGDTWRDLFDVVIVSAAKPSFFQDTNPIYRVIDEEQSLLRPHVGPLETGHVYFGGNARLVEESLGTSGGHPLYVGDHLFGDVHVAKEMFRWRTALIVRELEDEIVDSVGFADEQAALEHLMAEKVAIDRQQARLRMAGRSASADLAQITEAAIELDRKIAPLAKAAAGLGNPTWGPLMRAGNDKSLFARQVERYADVYTSRVSNLCHETPYAYLRADRGSLPHDEAGRPH
jgi:HAD superfamily 5'-nucleotidase-like hydrolase